MSKKKAMKKRRFLGPLSAHECKTEKDICSLRRDNWSTEHGWMMVNVENDTVTICQQRSGEEKAGWVTLPRNEFARLCRGYFRPQARCRTTTEDSSP